MASCPGYSFALNFTWSMLPLPLLLLKRVCVSSFLLRFLSPFGDLLHVSTRWYRDFAYLICAPPPCKLDYLPAACCCCPPYHTFTHRIRVIPGAASV